MIGLYQKHGWMRLWRHGYGVSWKPSSAPLIFNQRNGYTKFVIMFWYRLTWLPRYKSMTLLDHIDAMLDYDAYTWAFKALSDLRASVDKYGSTPGRVQAVENIRCAISTNQRASAIGEQLPSDKYRTSRRYEGFQEERKR